MASSVKSLTLSPAITQEKSPGRPSLVTAVARKSLVSARAPCIEQEKVSPYHSPPRRSTVHVQRAETTKTPTVKTEERAQLVFYKLIRGIPNGEQTKVYKAAEYAMESNISTGREFIFKINPPYSNCSVALAEARAYERCAAIPQVMQLMMSRTWDVVQRQYALVFPVLGPSLEQMFLRNPHNSYQPPQMPFEDLKRVAAQLLNGLANLRKIKVMHRNLSAENILTRRHPETNALEIQICGLKTACGEGIPIIYQPGTIDIGLIFNRAPEYYLLSKQTVAVDMWSVGCILFELYAGCKLFGISGDTDGDKSDHLRLIIKECGPPPTHWISHQSCMSRFFSLSAQGENVWKHPFNDKRSWWSSYCWQDRIRFVSGVCRKISIKETENFIKLLSTMLTYSHRIKPHAALRHPFFSSPTTTNKS